MKKQTIAEMLAERKGLPFTPEEVTTTVKKIRSEPRKSCNMGFRPVKPRSVENNWTREETENLLSIIANHTESDILVRIRVIKQQWD